MPIYTPAICYNSNMTPASFLNTFLAYANQLKFRNLFLIITALFVADLVVPDFIPLFDEIILGLLAIILANWKKDRRQEKVGNIIEGEIINGDDKEQ
jgi:Family of unknown function (DUF6116)